MRRRINYYLYISLLILGLGGISSVAVWSAARNWQNHQYQLLMDKALESYATAFKSELNGISIAISSMRNFFLSSAEVMPEEFSSFVQPYLSGFGGIHGLVWIPQIQRDDRLSFEVWMNTKIKGYSIVDFQGEKAGVLPKNNHYVYPIAFADPPEKNVYIKGLDMGSHACTYAAIEQALIKKTLTVSERIPLLCKDDASAGVFIVLPVYADESFAPYAVDGKKHLVSFVGGIIEIREVFDHAIRSLRDQHIHVDIRDISNKSESEDGEMLCCHLSPSGEDSNKNQQAYYEELSHEERVVDFGGRIWILKARPTQSFFQQYRFVRPGWFLAGGIFCTFLVGVNLLLLISRNRAVEGMVGARTRELMESEKKFSLIAENIREVFWLYSQDKDEFVYISPAFEKIFGKESDAYLGNALDAWQGDVHPDDVRIFAEARTGGRNKEEFEIEYRIVNQNGRVRWLSEQVTPILNEQGTPTMLVGNLSDITKRKDAEEEKARLEAQYLQTQKVEAAGRLAGGVAHDMNNLLSPIIGYSQLLDEDTSIGELQREYLNEILHAGFRCRDLVRQLLAFSRKQPMEYKPINLNTTITQFEKLLRRTIHEDVDIKIVSSPGLPNITGDPGQIEQVIMNLAINAQDAMSEGGLLTIETSKVVLEKKFLDNHLDVAPGSYVVLAVSDSGEGMSEETMEHMFDPFYTTKGDMGTGLGLATVYGIVRQHGGSIWTYSELNSGTTIKIYFPVSDMDAVDGMQVKEGDMFLSGDETILLVEDDTQVRQLVQRILEHKGYDVIVAPNGPEAIKFISTYTGRLDMLLTDVVMPKMNGKKLYENLLEKFPELKVIYMSGYTDDMISHKGILDEGGKYIQKPLAPEALLIKVREVLDE